MGAAKRANLVHNHWDGVGLKPKVLHAVRAGMITPPKEKNKPVAHDELLAGPKRLVRVWRFGKP